MSLHPVLAEKLSDAVAEALRVTLTRQDARLSEVAGNPCASQAERR